MSARGSLMAAAFAGGAAIQKGLGPAHAIALACSDQDLHHGTLIGIALPIDRGLGGCSIAEKGSALAKALRPAKCLTTAAYHRSANPLTGASGSLRQAGYRAGPVDDLVDIMVHSPFNRSSPYAPSRQEYRDMTMSLLA